MTPPEHTFRGKVRIAIGQLRVIPLAIRLAWDATPRWTLIWMASLVLQTLPAVLLLYVTRDLVNRLATIRPGDPQFLSSILVDAGLLVGVALAGELLRALTTYWGSLHSERLQDHIHALVQRKAVSLDMEFYDLPEFYDHLHRAQSEAYYRPAVLIQSLGGLIQQGLLLLSMMLVLWQISWILPVVLLLAAIPALWLWILPRDQRNKKTRPTGVGWPRCLKEKALGRKGKWGQVISPWPLSWGVRGGSSQRGQSLAVRYNIDGVDQLHYARHAAAALLAELLFIKRTDRST